MSILSYSSGWSGWWRTLAIFIQIFTSRNQNEKNRTTKKKPFSLKILKKKCSVFLLYAVAYYFQVTVMFLPPSKTCYSLHRSQSQLFPLGTLSRPEKEKKTEKFMFRSGTLGIVWLNKTHHKLKNDRCINIFSLSLSA